SLPVAHRTGRNEQQQRHDDREAGKPNPHLFVQTTHHAQQLHRHPEARAKRASKDGNTHRVCSHPSRLLGRNWRARTSRGRRGVGIGMTVSVVLLASICTRQLPRPTNASQAMWPTRTTTARKLMTKTRPRNGTLSVSVCTRVWMTRPPTKTHPAATSITVT